SSKKTFKEILKKLGMSAHELLRDKDAKAMDLDADALSEDELIDVMLENPRLIQRPILLANGKAALGRPPENVLDIL
ncbi:MAG: ArsC/Spx/MgsR family protein, partial [Rhodospirillales bacterium]